MSFGTDGTDGPTDAAGGQVTGETLARGQSRGMSVDQYLQENNAYEYLEALGDGSLIKTGPTGTNVADIAMRVRLPFFRKAINENKQNGRAGPQNRPHHLRCCATPLLPSTVRRRKAKENLTSPPAKMLVD
eukprot:scaffold1661_cov251-Pinguiococcus_pyrenoidosus.AAC.26